MMNVHKGLSVCVALAFVLFPIVCQASHIWETEHADTHGAGNVKTIVELEGQKDGKERSYSLPRVELIYAFTDWSTVTLASEATFLRDSSEHHSTGGPGDVELELKYTPLHFDFGHIGAQAGIKFPTADDDRDLGTGETDVEARLVHSYFGEGFETHLNAGVAALGNPEHRSRMETVFTYAAAYVRDVHPSFYAFAELQGQTGKSVFGTESLLRSGFAYYLRPNIELGLAGLVGLTNDSPNWGVKAGFYWTWERCKKVSHDHD
jgi:hypothetical protein